MTHMTILRLPVVRARVGLSRSTIYKFIESGHFPKPVQLGTRAVGSKGDRIGGSDASC